MAKKKCQLSLDVELALKQNLFQQISKKLGTIKPFQEGSMYNVCISVCLALTALRIIYS